MDIFILKYASITTLPHVSMCCVQHHQGELLITCTKPSDFYSVCVCVYVCICVIGCAIEYNIYTFVVTKYFL